MGSSNSEVYDAVIAFPLSRRNLYLGIQLAGERLAGIDYKKDIALKAAVNTNAKRVVRQLMRYFSDPLCGFDLPLGFNGTPFQIKVWQALLQVPPGTVLTYGQLADRLATGARAIGNACRHNPIPIVVPCHRIISGSGIGGYSGATQGGEVQIKKQLLEHEHFQNITLRNGVL